MSNVGSYRVILLDTTCTAPDTDLPRAGVSLSTLLKNRSGAADEISKISKDDRIRWNFGAVCHVPNLVILFFICF